MSISLRDQLLAAGLGTKKKAKEIEHQQRHQNWKKPEVKTAADQQRNAAQAQAQAAKAARDQALNLKRKEEADRRARWAEIKQLVAQNAIARAPENEEAAFNFIDRGKVRRIYANAEHRVKIIEGALVLVRCEGRYHLVPPEIAKRIAEREPNAVVTLTAAPAGAAPAEDDPYKDFVVPDDLKW